VALALLTTGGGVAHADDDAPEKSQARVLLSQGNALFERGDLRGALADFRAAYALYPSPKLLVNAAAAERELGDLAGAATDLRHFLDDATDDDVALIDRAKADLERLERRVGRVGWRAWPARSTLEVDGRPARDPTYVKPGTHQVKARSPNGVEETGEIEVSAGDSVEVPLPKGALLGTPEPPRTTMTAVPPPRTRKGGREGGLPGWGIALIVTGAAALVAGGVAAAIVLAPNESRPLSGDLGMINVHF
jgi:hypothetical protein